MLASQEQRTEKYGKSRSRNHTLWPAQESAHNSVAQWCFCDSHMQSHQFVAFNGGFFSCPDEAISHRARGQILLAWGQITRKVTDQRYSARRTGPAGSDKARYVTTWAVSVQRERSMAMTMRPWGEPNKRT